MAQRGPDDPTQPGRQSDARASPRVHSEQRARAALGTQGERHPSDAAPERREHPPSSERRRGGARAAEGAHAAHGLSEFQPCRNGNPLA